MTFCEPLPVRTWTPGAADFSIKEGVEKALQGVTPAKAGVQKCLKILDSGLRQNDENDDTEHFSTPSENAGGDPLYRKQFHVHRFMRKHHPMTIPDDFNFIRYLTAKKTIDDRALNRSVYAVLIRELKRMEVDGPLRVLELGAGIGTMIERLVAWKTFSSSHPNVIYTAVDSDAACMAEARLRFQDAGGAIAHENEDGRLVLSSGKARVEAELQTMNVFDLFDRERSGRPWDLVIAHAFLDLIDVPSSMPIIFSLLKPGGFFYFTLNFDGVTIFEPAREPDFEARMLDLYHRSMDRRLVDGKSSGHSRTGRRLFHRIREAGGAILEAGSSDWTVFPRENGYTDDEAYFLHFILHTIHRELTNHPLLDQKRLAAWVEQRRLDVERGRLVYIAHQMDFVGRV